jgi:hypothetical protein
MRFAGILDRPFRAVRRRWRRLTGSRPTSRGTSQRLPPDDDAAWMNVVFLGGTGRSGSSITSLLLGAHPAYVRIAIETKFIPSPGGLLDLAAGRTTYREFEARMLGPWFEPGPNRGLQLIMDRATLEAALPILRDGLRADPWAAGRRFTHALFDPIARAAGKPGWIEKFPANVRKADLLYRMFPNMRLVHMIRDGRDVACSVTRFGWGPSDPDEALEWWKRRVERGFEATDRVPADRILVVQMEDLTRRHREREYRRLLDFLGLEDAASMREYFMTTVSEARSHSGRWRTDVPADRLAAFEAHHDRLARELWDRGRPYAPIEDAAVPAGVA